jgi:hypothetical protein
MSGVPQAAVAAVAVMAIAAATMRTDRRVGVMVSLQ